MPVDPALAQEAAEAVSMTLRMRLTAYEWTLFDEAVARLTAALDDGDETALREAVLDLDEMAFRVSREVGEEPDQDEEDDPEVEASAARRDLGNELIRRIGTGAPDRG
ncbi:CATRA system-associated protein [Streptomyces sp. NPDC059378]|uniref:CATRA system-associated protein n=1 Tax=Streptomyces sp. NPDC059378 TaxID=3346815 RepID=UPI0036BA0446